MRNNISISEIKSIYSETSSSSNSPNFAKAITIGVALQLAGINVLWGASSVAAKYSLTAMGPFTLTILRFLPAGLLILFISRRQGGRTQICKGDGFSFFLMGLVGIALTYAVFYMGMQRTTATDSSLIFACEPLLIALCARIFLKERLRTRQWAGMSVGLAGIWLIAGQAVGNQIALLALCLESTTTIIGKRLTMRYPGLFVAGIEMVIGALLLLPFALLEMYRTPIHLTWQAIAGLLYLSLICSALCYGVWYHLLFRFPVSAMGVFILVQPMTGPFYGWLLRGESLKAGSAIGGLMVMIGIALTVISKASIGKLRPESLQS